jgi:hypothetical protein
MLDFRMDQSIFVLNKLELGNKIKTMIIMFHNQMMDWEKKSKF